MFDHARRDPGRLDADHGGGDPVGPVAGAQGRRVFDAVQERHDERVGQHRGGNPRQGGVEGGVLHGDQARVDRFPQLGVGLDPGREVAEAGAADPDAVAAQGLGGLLAGQADHAVAGAGEQGREQAAHAAGTQDGHAEFVRHEEFLSSVGPGTVAASERSWQTSLS